MQWKCTQFISTQYLDSENITEFKTELKIPLCLLVYSGTLANCIHHTALKTDGNECWDMCWRKLSSPICRYNTHIYLEVLRYITDTTCQNPQLECPKCKAQVLTTQLWVNMWIIVTHKDMCLQSAIWTYVKYTIFTLFCVFISVLCLSRELLFGYFPHL